MRVCVGVCACMRVPGRMTTSGRTACIWVCVCMCMYVYACVCVCVHVCVYLVGWPRAVDPPVCRRSSARRSAVHWRRPTPPWAPGRACSPRPPPPAGDSLASRTHSPVRTYIHTNMVAKCRMTRVTGPCVLTHKTQTYQWEAYRQLGNRTYFSFSGHHQMFVHRGWWGAPQMNKFEQVSSDHQQVSLAGVPQCDVQGVGGCTVRFNASWPVLTWDPPSLDRMTHIHDWKHYLPAIWLEYRMNGKGQYPQVEVYLNIINKYGG